MMEYLTSAWANWLQFVGYTKIVGLFMIVVAVVWLLDLWKRRWTFTVTSLVCVCLCLLPFSVAVLQVYQTPFYEYSWIWALVPMLPFLAFGVTEVYTKLWYERKFSRHTRFLVTALGAALCVLSISFNGPAMREPSKRSSMEEVKSVLETVKEYGQETLEDRLVLWAPEQIVSYARIFAPDIALYYGRNMWQTELNVYTDDRYSEEQVEDYVWMEQIYKEFSNEGVLNGVEQIESAVKNDVNVILFDRDTSTQIISDLEEYFSVEAGRIEGYYVFFMTPEMVQRYEQRGGKN